MRILILNHNQKEQGTYFRALNFGHHPARRGHNAAFFLDTLRIVFEKHPDTRLLLVGPELFTRHNIGIATRPTPEDFAGGILSLSGQPEALATLDANARRVAETELNRGKLTDKLAEFLKL